MEILVQDMGSTSEFTGRKMDQSRSHTRLFIAVIVMTLACIASCLDSNETKNEHQTKTEVPSSPSATVEQATPFIIDVAGIATDGVNYLRAKYSLDDRDDLTMKSLPDTEVTHMGENRIQHWVHYINADATFMECAIMFYDDVNSALFSFDVDWYAAEHSVSGEEFLDELMRLYEAHNGILQTTPRGKQQYLFDIGNVRIGMLVESSNESKYRISMMVLPPGTQSL